jgi:hypothetical protein
MRKYAIVLLVGMVAILGSACGEPTPLPAPTLEAPANGSTVTSLTPILTWSASTSGALYRLQVANDANFSNLVIDQQNLAGLSYSVPAGKLSEGQTYYWKIRASKDNQDSSWSTYWSFLTPAPQPPPPSGTSEITVSATVDGASWTGNVSYGLSGPQAFSGSSVTQTFSNVPVGTYTVTYYSGGPSGATLASITPQPTQTTVASSTTTFTLNFNSQGTGDIRVEATLDGVLWQGSVRYTLQGPTSLSGSSVSWLFKEARSGTYTLIYQSGGPRGATLVSITPKSTQTSVLGSVTTFYLNFVVVSKASNTIRVRASLDGLSWSGSIHYQTDGPGGRSDDLFSVPGNYYNMPDGMYTVGYISGGPAGATLTSITPSSLQTVSGGKTISFTFRFHSVATSKIKVEATLDGLPWSGPCEYTVSGPYTDSNGSVPYTFTNVPEGTYTITFWHGGPLDSVLQSVTPSAAQDLVPDGMIVYTLEFASVVAVPSEQ